MEDIRDTKRLLDYRSVGRRTPVQELDTIRRVQ